MVSTILPVLTCRSVFYVSLLLSMVLSGCVTSTSPPEVRWQPVARNEGNQVHVVIWPKESLPAIASWYTGSSDNAETIANANPTLNPLHLRQGDQVFIPHALLKTRGSMSKDFLETFNAIPVVTITTTGGANVVKTPRIITPTPYKEKTGREMTDSASSHDPGVVHGSQPAQPASTTSTPEPPPDEDIHLFGPK